MLAALIIVFREVFEAGLIVGIVLAVTRTVAGRNAYIGGGVAAGIVGSCVVAGFAGAIAKTFAGMGQELFNAAILSVAVMMLTWHNVWMSRHGAELAGDLRAAGQAVVDGRQSLLALAVVVAVAVLREGSEVVLFLYGVLAGQGTTAWDVALGGFAGLGAGAALCASTYLGLVRIPMKSLFAVTTVLIALLAAGMASQAVAFLQQAGWLTALSETLWDSGWLLSSESVLGQALHTLVGYTDQPTGMQLIVYAGVLIVTFTLMKLFAAPVRRAAGPAQAAAN